MLSKDVLAVIIASAGSLLLASFLVVQFPHIRQAHAAISSCSATVSPTTVATVTSQQFSFTMGSISGVAWIKITRPSSNFTITNASAHNWSSSMTSSTATFTPESGASSTLTLDATSGSSQAGSADWTVQVSDDAGGASPTTCTGTLGTAISNPGAGTPVISNIVVSDVTDTSVKITWTTDEASNSVVDYGTTEDYGSTKSDSSSVTSHSIIIDSLTANTTYHYNIKSTDSDGNTGESNDNTFVAAKASSTATTTVTTTTTTTVTKDQSPAVTLSIDTAKSYKDSPEINGTAVDDKGVDSLDYTVDGGTTWIRVVDVENLGSKQVTFSFAPKGLRDGKRAVKARAKDTAGNTSLSNEITLTIDQKPPAVTLDTDLLHAYAASPTIVGTATDPAGEATIEYSLDNGKNWLPVDQIQIVNASTITYSFTPAKLEDGNYSVNIRAMDPVGNSGVADSGILIIDRLPPIIGGVLFAVGPYLLASQNGVVVQEDTEIHLIFSAAGGPTSIELSATPASQGETLQGIAATKNPHSGLWSAKISFPEAGTYTLTAHAIDGAGNNVTHQLQSLVVLENGKTVSDDLPIANASVSVFYFETTTQSFNLWNGSAFSQQNPQKTGSNGKYSLLLPPGKYYMTVESSGFESITTAIFTTDKYTPITHTFSLKKAFGISLGPLKLTIPNLTKYFGSESEIVSLGKSSAAQNTQALISAVGTNLPLVDIESADGNPVTTTAFLGKPTVLTFLASWLPQASEQVEILEELSERKEINAIPIMLQDTPSTALIFQKRAGFLLPFYADRDGVLVEPLGISTLPTHVFLDRRGTVKDIKVGILGKEELLDNLSQ